MSKKEILFRKPATVSGYYVNKVEKNDCVKVV